MIKVKICGLKSKEDVIVACSEGADAVGFIVGVTHKTDDNIDIKKAIELANYVPNFITPVLVTHLTDPSEIITLYDAIKITTLQLQGDISYADIVKIRKEIPEVTIIKAIHVTDMIAIARAKAYANIVDMILLDSRTPDKLGGTGLPHDWSISAKIVKEVNVPVILAGGLTPENVAEAIRIVNPYGVDVNTGVKKANGEKDPQKIKAFIQNAKSSSFN